MFNNQWFKKYQKFLVWFANTLVGRYILCINGKKSSIGKNKIIRILANSITWRISRNKYSTEFRSHDKFAKRIYNAFKPIWYLIHFWDTFFANNFQPNWNLGFDTLTAYPVAGANTPVDGYAFRGAVDETWANIRAGAGTTASDTSADNYFVYLGASSTTNQWSDLVRSFLLFDTSPLTAAVTISAATLSLFGTAKSSTFSTNPNIHINATTPAATNTIATSDYSNIGGTSFANILYDNWSITAYNDFTLDASGQANISKTGISKFGARSNWDINDSPPTWGTGYVGKINGYYADQAGTTNDPKLVVTYTLSVSNVTGYSFFM
jgi:hypothetical protein